MFYKRAQLLEAPSRVKFLSTISVGSTNKSGLYRQPDSEKTEIRTIFDTGCKNTLIPYALFLIGVVRETDRKDIVTVGGYSRMETFGVLMDTLKIGNATFHNVLGFTSPKIRGGVFDQMILGANVFSNWRYVVDYDKLTFQLKERKYGTQKPRYHLHFDENGNLVLIDDILSI
ncbi:hypothetical protein FACS1894188_01650 [Clostridia bacterium]|nr:hypothetical protein FACS1894188_01650 [Clostridia bacterium]